MPKMTFWGVEVKPGKPFTLDDDDIVGKLILTQATLGTGSSSKKSVLQVNVGDNSPVYLCTLLPDKSESCSLNLEFDEDDEVKFSVVGPTSIHLSGFVQRNRGCGHDLDSDGEDIDETESESSDYSSDDLSDDFSEEEDDVSMFRPSRVRNSGVVIEEIVDDEKNVAENVGAKQAKKKKQQPGSDSEKKADKQIVLKGELESEDEDGFPVSSRKSLTSDNPEANISTVKAEGGKGKKKDTLKEEGETSKGSKRKVDSISQDDEQKSDATVAANEDASEDKNKKQKKKKKAKTEKDEEVADMKQDASANTKQINKTNDKLKKSETKSAKPRTFANGFIIEELSMGKPNGKRASRGKKVSVHYVGKLQKNGKQFDANIGRKPFKFRLGVGAVIKGWDVGLEGMRVGDKRRLTIPPSMGYGAAGAPPQIPPNAWLVFEVELVDVA